MERLEDLNVCGFKIYQDDELYCFTSDAVLLSHFATVKKGDEVADFCSGCGIVGINLLGLNFDKVKSVHLFEMQEELFSLSEKSVEYNELKEKVFPINSKVQDLGAEYNERFSLAVCNPPYMEKNGGFVAEDYKKAVCRAEIEITLKELVRSVSKALKFGGRFAVVCRADRLCELIYEMKSRNIEPKRMQLVYARKKEPYLVLLEGVKGGKKGLKILRPIEN